MRIAVAGAGGRMGQRLAALAAAAEDLELVAVWEAPGSPLGGQTVAGLTIGDDPAAALANAEVYIDFTRPDPSLNHARIAAEHGVAGVIGTTGFAAPPDELFAPMAEAVPLVIAPNMSVGVNLLLRLVTEAARALGPAYDTEVLDLHHRWKEDAPSGTAKALIAAVAAGRDEAAPVRHGREGLTGARPAGEIGVHALRLGDVVGDHTVFLAGLGERIELTHRASSRDTFAHGALRAARWLAGRRPGIYGMADVLGWT